MPTSPAVSVQRKDYRPYPYLVDKTELRFDLQGETTIVRARLHLRRAAGSAAGSPLPLCGRELELLSVCCNSRPLEEEEYLLDANGLTVTAPPATPFTLDIETVIHPATNTALEGLYLSNGRFCTQCEAEGFRRLTFFPDRPDVLSLFEVTLVAEQKRYPILLANGNLIETGELEDGLHYARWSDPFPKPSYLFALVAGDLVCLADQYVTRAGRAVDLRIYVEERNRDKCAHALQSLQEAMRWDEEVFGLAYDLDIYMIVAVDDFNMGAMENKGLNIFNSRYVLARPETATDADYQAIREVIGHEYFHNWTGNRVTCRDWFQLSLKEGLTVFRDQIFSADHGSAAVKRIQDVRTLRSGQFPEDAGPMSHPVRPESYQEINNFYTATVYNKGAEVIRMYHTLLGHAAFVRGVNLYLQRHDGRAATIDDFLQAMEEASGRDLSHFGRWYSQSGTPLLDIVHRHDAASATLELTVRQSTPPTADQTIKGPLHIPLAVGVLGPDGNDVLPTTILEVRNTEETFRLTGVPAGSVPSLLRGFSAPVRVRDDLGDAQRAFLLAHDSDPFSRWEAGQQLFTELILARASAPAYPAGAVPEIHAAAFRRVLLDRAGDPALRALTLTLPSTTVLAELQSPSDPALLHEVRETLRKELATPLITELQEIYAELATPAPYRPDGPGVGRRSLKQLCLTALACAAPELAVPLALNQLRQANNMTDTLGALAALVETGLPAAADPLAEFHARWQGDPLILDKWFTLQATAGHAEVFATVVRLTAHPDFNLRNPNRVRALLGAFANGNPGRFHRQDGAAYELLADYILELDHSNPQIAARLAAPLSRWRPLAAPYRERLRAAVERIAAQASSGDVREIVGKSLQEVSVG